MSIANRPRLGKGLKALISQPVAVHAGTTPTPDAPATTTSQDRLSDIPTHLIDPNPHQPRAAIDPLALQELANSIKASGILQPVILRPTADGRYQLVAGHRRTEAAKLANLPTVPALLKAEATDEQQAEWALIENIQRQDLNPIERAKAYRTYLNAFHFTHAQAAERLGEDRTTISNFLRLLDLNPGVQDLVVRGLLTAGHAKVLAGITDPARQDALANRIITEGLSVRKLEEALNTTEAVGGSTDTVTVAPHQRHLSAKSPHVVELEQDLSRKLGTKLRIHPAKKKNTGKIVIQYFSLDEFDRIVEKFN